MNSLPALLGGPAACNVRWPTWPLHDVSEERQLLEVLHSGKWWFGAKVQQFESAFAAFQGAAHAVSCTNGTTAIELGLRALGVTNGDEVIVPPYSFIATASAVVTVGAIPVFADILPSTLCLNPLEVAKKVTPRTRAIVPVHVAGMMADMDSLLAIARTHTLQVLEDSAHAWGSALDGRGAGVWGGCGTFSFQETKNITAGEGGMLVTDNSELADLCRSFTHCGRTKGGDWYDHDVLGSNLRLTEFQAAILIAQLSRLEQQIATRERNAAMLDQVVAACNGLQAIAVSPRMTRRSYHMYVFLIDRDSGPLPRDRFVQALRAEGVPATAGWYRPLYQNGLFQRAHIGPRHGIRSPLADDHVDYRDTYCPVAERVCRDAVWIPHYCLLGSAEETERIGEAIAKTMAHAELLASSRV